MWILILTLSGNFLGSPRAMTVAEFSDAKACDMARTAWASVHAREGKSTAFCFPKSSTIPERKQ